MPKLTFSQWILVGLLLMLFIYGLLATLMTHDTSNLIGSAGAILGTAFCYGFFSWMASNL